VIPARSALRLARRAATIWVIEVAALLLLVRLVRGLHVQDWPSAFVAIGVIGLLNALVRPVLVLLTLPFTVLSFGLLTLLLNGLVVYAAAAVVPGLTVAGLHVAVVAAFGLAATNTVITGLLSIGDEDSFYRNVTRRLARRAAAPPTGAPGLVVIEIDGLAEPILRRAVAAGIMETVARWLGDGTHALTPWECDLPSQTSSSQAGIFWGANAGIPGFRWYEKERGRLMDSKRGSDAAEIERRISNGRGLLHRDGTSCNNMLSGDAARAVLTLSRMGGLTTGVGRRASNFRLYFLNPYNVTRALTLLSAELVVEVFESLRARVSRRRPRVGRGGSFPLVRALATVVLRDLTVWFVAEEMFKGRSVVYASFVGYDVVAHHAGTESPDALRVLRRLDEEIGVLERAALDAPRPYRFVVLSDHGQSQGDTFRQRYGLRLEQLVERLAAGELDVHAATEEAEGRAHVGALLLDAASGRTARRVLERQNRREEEREASRAGAAPRLVVCASGNLGLVYLADRPGRVTMEELARDYPVLLAGLAEHPGIGFVLVRSGRHGPLVLGGVHRLATGEVAGLDPLRPYGPHAARLLRELDADPHAGDVVVNGRLDPVTGEVPAFEELAGSHGGLGGPQTAAFLVHPAELGTGERELVGAASLHGLLSGWVDELPGFGAPEPERPTPEPQPAPASVGRP
jgi:uncharacterized membrane protein YvlD (DUF360 family)